ncbi:MAG: hypothetical protein AAF928_03450 [Myxococcota bacterium]
MTKRFHARSWFSAALLGAACAFTVLPVAGCGLKEGMENALEVNKDIKDEFGVMASVNFNKTNGKTNVKVELSEAPEGDTKEIKAKVEGIVRKHFPDVDEVDVKM